MKKTSVFFVLLLVVSLACRIGGLPQSTLNTTLEPAQITENVSQSNAPVSSSSKLQLTIDPFDYKLEEGEDGWMNGSVKVAFKNATKQFLLDQSLGISELFPIGEILLETKEGPTYPVNLLIGEYPESWLYLRMTAAGIPPGFRFSKPTEVCPNTSVCNPYVLGWRSAAAATPKRIKFIDQPELDFDLPSDFGTTLNFPFDTPPSDILPITSLKGVDLVNDPEGIRATFTGRCGNFYYFAHELSSEQLGDMLLGQFEPVFINSYWLELNVVNSDKFNEKVGSLKFPYTVYAADGTLSFRQNATIRKFLGSSIDDTSVSAGPGQSITAYIQPFSYNGEETVPKPIIIVAWSDDGYKIYDTSLCNFATR
jgi:hypothetical protein